MITNIYTYDEKITPYVAADASLLQFRTNHL